MGNIKEINIENRAYYFYVMAKIQDFNASLLKTDKKSYKTLIFIKLDVTKKILTM